MYEYYSAPGYANGFEARGFNILEWQTFGDYQGDYAIIFKRDNEFGFLVLGYGSCSGCDAMEACSSEEEYVDLMHSVINSIYWGTAEETIARITNEFDDNNWYRNDSSYERSIELLVEAVEKNV